MLRSDDLLGKTFGKTRFREGYNMGQVNGLVSRSARTLRAYESGARTTETGEPLVTADDVLSFTFDTTKFTEGYDLDDVDDFLDEIIATLVQHQSQAAPPSPGPTAAPGVSAYDPSAYGSSGSPAVQQPTPVPYQPQGSPAVRQAADPYGAVPTADPYASTPAADPYVASTDPYRSTSSPAPTYAGAPSYAGSYSAGYYGAGVSEPPAARPEAPSGYTPGVTAASPSTPTPTSMATPATVLSPRTTSPDTTVGATRAESSLNSSTLPTEEYRRAMAATPRSARSRTAEQPPAPTPSSDPFGPGLEDPANIRVERAERPASGTSEQSRTAATQGIRMADAFGHAPAPRDATGPRSALDTSALAQRETRREPEAVPAQASASWSAEPSSRRSWHQQQAATDTAAGWTAPVESTPTPSWSTRQADPRPAWSTATDQAPVQTAIPSPASTQAPAPAHEWSTPEQRAAGWTDPTPSGGWSRPNGQAQTRPAVPEDPWRAAGRPVEALSPSELVLELQKAQVFKAGGSADPVMARTPDGTRYQVVGVTYDRRGIVIGLG